MSARALRPGGRKGSVPLLMGSQPEPHELPALMRIEEVAIGLADVPFRRGAGAAAKHELIAHELAVIFADGAGRCLESGIGEIGAPGPFPHIAIDLIERAAAAGLRPH